MVIAILLVVGYFVIAFFLDKKEEVSRVKDQGGIRTKYSLIINYFIGVNNKAKIIKESSTSITVMTETDNVIQLYTLAHGFSDFTVFWEFRNSIFGTHNLHWSFSENTDQSKAILQINEEIESYILFLAKQHL